MKKFKLFTIAAVLAISALASAEDKPSTAPSLPIKLLVHQIQGIAFSTAIIAANCAIEEATNKLLTMNTDANKSNINMSTNEDKPYAQVYKINKCVANTIMQMKIEATEPQ